MAAALGAVTPVLHHFVELVPQFDDRRLSAASATVRFACMTLVHNLARLLPRFAAAALLSVGATRSAAQATPIPATSDRWNASDSIRFETYLGRPSIYINRGVALARGVALRDGTIEFDMAATPRTNFLGTAFHAASLDNSEVVFFRIASSGTTEAVQYGPALRNYGVAWQVYHGPGANAVAELERERWMHVRIVLAGDSARLYLNRADSATLVVPRLAGVDGNGVGLWAGNFGRGAYFSNFTVTSVPNASAAGAPRALPRGTIADWELSQSFNAESTTPGALPRGEALTWEKVRADRSGIVLINRYRQAPIVNVPFDATTGIVNEDSVMGGRVRGTKVVYARTILEAARDTVRRMEFGYSDGIAIYANGQPLYFGMNPQNLRDDLGVMSRRGDAVYLPLKRGRNEIVVAVTEYSGGWAFWARQ